WKSTYRIVMPTRSDAKPLLQGWAIVDNTVGEDWDNVQLSLIAGSPQSFIQEISQPYYARRPVVNLPEMAMLTPQTHEQTLQNFNPSAAVVPTSTELASSRDRLEQFAKLSGDAGGGVGSGHGAGVGPGSGGGMAGGTYRVNAPTNSAMAGASAETVAVDAMLENQQITAETKDVGDLFEYKIKQPVTIRKNQSALVPILQARIDAEKVSLWAPGNQRALRALWLTNSSGLTLDRGTFSIQEGETFAGEGLVDPIKPGEKRLISYAADPSIVI